MSEKNKDRELTVLEEAQQEVHEIAEEMKEALEERAGGKKPSEEYVLPPREKLIHIKTSDGGTYYFNLKRPTLCQRQNLWGKYDLFNKTMKEAFKDEKALREFNKETIRMVCLEAFILDDRSNRTDINLSPKHSKDSKMCQATDELDELDVPIFDILLRACSDMQGATEADRYFRATSNIQG